MNREIFPGRFKMLVNKVDDDLSNLDKITKETGLQFSEKLKAKKKAEVKDTILVEIVKPPKEIEFEYMNLKKGDICLVKSYSVEDFQIQLDDETYDCTFAEPKDIIAILSKKWETK